MDTRTLIDNLLASGRDFAERGRDVAEEKLNIPESGPERDAMLSGMGKGALAAGALALMLGTRGGRKVTGGAIKLGSLAALGGLAYSAYRKWQNNQQGEGVVSSSSPSNPADDTSDEHSRLVLSAMIAAAKADGHVDEQERNSLQAFIDQIGESDALSVFVQQELTKPLDPAELASRVDNQETATEIYLASLLIVDRSNFMASTYLNELAKALGLPQDLQENLQREVPQP